MYNLQVLFAAILPFIWSMPVSAAPGLVARDQTGTFKTTTQTPSGNQKPSPNTQAAHVLTLEQRSGTATSAGYAQSLRQNTQVNGVYGTSDVSSVEGGLVFVTEIGVGTENFTVVVDTGSSDTWLVKTGFACSKGTTEAACQFGHTYDPSSTFEPVDNENFEFSYTDGEYLFGPYGKEQVTVAGVTVKDQQIATVQSANWNGDGVSSGVLGLGFPGNTGAYSGASQISDGPDTHIQYNPFFTSATTEGSVAPLFSLALSRDATGGMLAIGGLPPVAYVPVFASTPFQLLAASSTSASAGAKPDYTFYTITTNGFEYQSAQKNWNVGSWLTYFGNPNDASQVQVIVDSATTVNYLPQVTADRVNALFEPAATYDATLGYYTVDCNAKAPEFGVRIGQEIFYVNPTDNIIKLNAKGCITGIARTGTGGKSTLGTVFLKSVLAVFDIGAGQMRFAAREYS